MKFAYLIEPPFNLRTDEGIVTGCDVELAKVVFERISIDKFEPIEAEFADLLPGVAEGRWKMTTGLFSTVERRQVATFSRPIWALPDGLLVPSGNPKGLNGYQSVAESADCKIAVIRDQFQHRSAIEFGVSEDYVRIFETYTEAANSVLEGETDAYASVGRAHTGYLDLHSDLALEVVTVPTSEKAPAFGSFGFSLSDNELCAQVDDVLVDYLGSDHHRSMMKEFGFTDSEVNLVVSSELKNSF